MEIDMTSGRKERIALRVSWVTIVGNVALSVFKLAAGIVANSGAMVSDAVHSMSDVFSTFIVMIGVKMAHKEADADHPYGHERMESIAALLLSLTLAATGVMIGYWGIMKIAFSNAEPIAVPGALALSAAIASIVVKEAMYWYTRAAAKKIHSTALMASAWHHRSDALSSVGSFVGIFGARLGLPVLDPIASVVICLFILKAALDIFRDATRKMTDAACDEETAGRIREIARSQSGVLCIDNLKTRLFGDRIYVDIEIATDAGSTLEQAHGIAEQVHDAIERGCPNIKHCMVHVNPYDGQEEQSP